MKSNLAVIDLDDEVGLPPPNSLSLDLPESTSFERWQEFGRELAAREKVLNWWIGDWWAFGEHRYGERAKMAAEGVFGKAFQTLRNVATVCRSVETSRRRDTLSWSHHQEVASLAPEQADEILNRAEAEGMSSSQVRAAVQVAQGREVKPKHLSVTPVADNDAALSSLIRFYNRHPQAVRADFCEMAAEAKGAEIEP